jgi:hypothetical protein
MNVTHRRVDGSERFSLPRYGPVSPDDLINTGLGLAKFASHKLHCVPFPWLDLDGAVMGELLKKVPVLLDLSIELARSGLYVTSEVSVYGLVFVGYS